MVVHGTYLSVFVSDLNRAITYYRDGLGLHLEEGASIPGQYAQFSLGNGSSLALFDESLRPAEAPRFELGLLVKDVDAVHDSWGDHGVLSPENQPMDLPFGRTFALTAPEGYSLRVIEPPH
jgi:catechol 2,3-dioxygenase-like lactoylglutathione lyase family enzyme